MIARPQLYRFCPFCAAELGTKTESDGQERQHCLRCGWVHYPHAAVSVAGVLAQHGRVLLVRRKNEPFAGTWHCPAGFVEYGEHPASAVTREFAEETGLTTMVGRLLDMFISTDDPREPGHLALFFEVKDPRGALIHNTAENLDIAWFDLEHLPQIPLELHRSVLHRVRRDLRPKARV